MEGCRSKVTGIAAVVGTFVCVFNLAVKTDQSLILFQCDPGRVSRGAGRELLADPPGLSPAPTDQQDGNTLVGIL